MNYSAKPTRQNRSKNAKKTAGILLISLASLCLIALTTNILTFFGDFLRGFLGLFAYLVFLCMLLIGIALIKNARYQFRLKYIVFVGLIVFASLALLQLLFTGNWLLKSFSYYTKQVYHKLTPAGLFVGVFVYAVKAVIFLPGAYVFFIMMLGITTALLIDYLHGAKQFKKLSHRLASFEEYREKIGSQPAGSHSSFDNPAASHYSLNKKEPDQEFIPNTLVPINLKKAPTKYEQKEEKIKTEDAQTRLSDQEVAKRQLFGFHSRMSEQEVKEAESQKLKYILTPQTAVASPSIQAQEYLANLKGESLPKKEEQQNLQPQAEKTENATLNFLRDINRPAKRMHNDIGFNQDFFTQPSVMQADMQVAAQQPSLVEEKEFKPKPVQKTVSETQDQIHKIIEEIKEESGLLNVKPEPLAVVAEKQNPVTFESKIPIQEPIAEVKLSPLEEAAVAREEPAQTEEQPALLSQERQKDETVQGVAAKFNFKPEKMVQATLVPETSKESKKQKPMYTSPSNYNRPPIELLNQPKIESKETEEEDFQLRAMLLEQTLDNFKVQAKVCAITKGPAVTRYELQMAPGNTVKKIQQYADDIAMSLESNGGIRIEAPIPGKNAVGIEVPNQKISTISAREVLDSYEFKNSSPLTFGLGKDIAGSTIVCDMKDMPHLLIAGSTGSGKSVCLNILLVSLLYKMGPDDLKLILIDPKRVEFSAFNGLPHLILKEAITEPKDAISALGWAMKEMDRRFELFHDVGVNQIENYNNRREVKSGTEPKLPTILIVIDELADLIMTAKREVEDKIRRLTQLARAAGIYLVVATQRPSVDVITGTIKANLPSRISFKVSSFADSKTILDQSGAENLLGKGDMLYYPRSYADPKRIQGSFISSDEIRAVTNYIIANNEACFDEEVEKEMLNKQEDEEVSAEESSGNEPSFDPIMKEALKLAIESRAASVTMVQRRFAVGYARAARIIDQMEVAKFISPADGSKPRSVYITMDDFKAIFGED